MIVFQPCKDFTWKLKNDTETIYEILEEDYHDMVNDAESETEI